MEPKEKEINNLTYIDEITEENERVKIRSSVSNKFNRMNKKLNSLYKNIMMKNRIENLAFKEKFNANYVNESQASMLNEKKDEKYGSFKGFNEQRSNDALKIDFNLNRPIVLRSASKWAYKGQRIEISDINFDLLEKSRQTSILSICSSTTADSRSNEYQYFSLKSNQIYDSSSGDDLQSLCSDVTEDSSFDEMMFEEESREEEARYFNRKENNFYIYDRDYFILGASMHSMCGNREQILSLPLMDSIRNYLPPSVSEQNFWLKYSLSRDSASICNLLHHSQGSTHTVLAIETIDGEVFGSFTSNTWNNHQGFFGSGESFLWRVSPFNNHDAKIQDTCSTNYGNLEIFPWTGKNNYIQYCSDNLIGLGGIPSERNSASGFGLAMDTDLLHVISEPCETFDNPRLAQLSTDGIFEVANIEVWTLTPCVTLEDAKNLEARELLVGLVP